MNALVKLPKLAEHGDRYFAKPSFLQLRVDEICTAEGKFGNIWQLWTVDPTKCDWLSDSLSSSLFTEIQTVEICSQSTLLHPKLGQWISSLCENLPRLNRIELVTPVLDPDRVIDCIIQTGSIAKTYKLHFTVRLSLLDLEHSFSELNQKNGVNSVDLQPLIRVLGFIQSCEFVTDSKLECIINQTTVCQLHDWLEFAIDHNISIVYRLGVPHQTTEANLPIEPDTFAFEEIYHLVIFLENLIRYYETSTTQIQFYQSLIGQLIDHKPRSVGCKWQPSGVTLSATGELWYCAIASKSLGSTLKQDPVSLHQTHQEHWHQILQTACCSCMQDCILPGETEAVSKDSKWSLYTLLKQVKLLDQVKSSKLLKPLKTFKLQSDFQKHLQTLGVNLSIQVPPKVAMHFPPAQLGKRKVLICGWYGTETLGDKAILGGVVQALQEAIEEVEFHLVAIEVYISQMTIQQMPELQGCVLHSLTEGLEIVQAMDLVVFGGGPLMAIGAMAEMMALFQRAVAANIPTVLTGCGVGPLGANFLNQAVRHVLLHSSYRIYRDQKSLENARVLGVDVSQDIVAEDPAFTWLASKTDRWKTVNNSNNLNSARLILGLRDWPYHEFAAEMGSLEAERLKQHFEQAVVAGLEQLVEQHPELEIIAFPMCTNHLGFDDRWFYRRLFRNHPKLKASVDFSYLDAELSPDASLAVFQSATAALTMRFHSLVFALSNGVPAVAIDYTLGQGKVKSLAEKYHVPYQGLDTISAEFIASSLSQILTGKANNSVAAFQKRILTFKDSVKAVVMLMD